MPAVRVILVVVGFFLSAMTACCQRVTVHVFTEDKPVPPGNDTIYYNFNRGLTWADFKGKPDPDHFAGAVTASGFAFDSQMNYDGTTVRLDIGVYTFFTKSDSWKKKDIHSAYHLLHEQHHFDISRLGAANFMEAVQKAHFTRSNYNKLLVAIFDRTYKDNADLQHLYDRETNHSIDMPMQRVWNKRIARAMQQLQSGISSPRPNAL